ncbi:MAG: transaldolase [Candidatus Dasytiphilus stammeri]
MNQLDVLKKYTKIALDSSDIEDMSIFHPTDVTTNPSLILRSSTLIKYNHVIKNAISYAKKIGGSTQSQLINALDKVYVNIGLEILKHISGWVSTEIDPRISFNRNMCVNRARKIIDLYQKEGIDTTSRVLIKIAATWEGICAAEILEKEDIHCNMTLLFSFAQAHACADAGVFLISPFVGRIYDWYQSKTSFLNYDPGVNFVKKIFNFYKKHQYATIVMASSFRNTEQIISLTGCDYLTLAPKLIQKVLLNKEPIRRKLILPSKVSSPVTKISENLFRWKHNCDAMAVEKLSEGIRNFYYDQKKLEELLLIELLQ